MRATRWTCACVISLAALFVACDDDDSGSEAGSAGAPGQSETALAPCLDRPSGLQRPPDGRLPCELLPPGFGK